MIQKISETRNCFIKIISVTAGDIDILRTAITILTAYIFISMENLSVNNLEMKRDLIRLFCTSYFHWNIFYSKRMALLKKSILLRSRKMRIIIFSLQNNRYFINQFHLKERIYSCRNMSPKLYLSLLKENNQKPK